MGIKYLLDTNILSELSKNKPDSNVVSHVTQYGDNCSTASIVIHEINYGINRLEEGNIKKNLQLFLKQLETYKFQIFPYDTKAACYHASERARLVKKGLTPAFADGQIAAIASTNNLILVTRNRSDFINFNDLLLENWFIEY
jgi:tRNA(fMet)-specific endonuclease VapC